MDEKFEERTGEYEGREAHRLKHAGAIALFLLSPVFSYVMFEFVTGNFVMVLPKNAVLNIVWMFALYLLVFGISGSTRISVPVSSVLLYAISLAEAFVVSFRSRPIMMGDVLAVKTAMTVAGSYDYTPTFMMIICGALLIIWNALAQFVFVRVKGKKKRAAVFSVSAGAVAVFIACFYNFMISGLSLEVNLWDPMTSYAENGYILSSAISIKYLVKKAPGGYSQAKIQEICDKYVDSEKERNGETAAVVASGDAVQPTNMICIMNESLSDLAVDGDFTTNIDYLPFLHSLTENTVKGKLCMPVFGAMTSNSEFEFLIGDSMYLMPRGSVAYQFYVNPGVRSMVSTVRDQGYIPVAMHPYPAENWNRRICYNNMGFSDTFTIKPYPTFIDRCEGNYQDTFEGRDIEGAKRTDYPLQLFTPHYPRVSHATMGNVDWLQEAMPDYAYVSTVDATERGVSLGDTIIVYNEAGKLLRKACPSERIVPGTVSIPHGGWLRWDEEEGLSRGGCENALNQGTSISGVHAYNSCLINFALYDGEPLEEDCFAERYFTEIQEA